ncbi:Six-hairpin glycosidase [Cadophora sp. DSE1049]|nr:Six-hairpin glycosidase [Cadophora sp. DSE1049]
MFLLHLEIIYSFLITLLPTTCVADVINSGFDVYSAAQVMMDKSSHSWEWGTAAEALLELYNNEISVFSSNPFPNGRIPSVSPNTLALSYAKQFINTDLQVLVPDSAVGDPASLGVSAILIGTSDSKYTNAAQRQADYILNQAPRWSNGAISHLSDVAEIWIDNMAMSFPFLAYLAVQQNNATLIAETVKQCGLHRDVLKASGTLNWRHIVGPQSPDPGLWSSGNGWAAYGMARVLNTLQKWSGSSGMTSQSGQLKGWIKEILDGALISGLQNGLLHNYLDDGSWFGEISGTAVLSAVAYRMAVNDPGMFPKKYIDWADANRKSLASHQSGGIFSPAVDPYAWLSRTEYVKGSPEGQAFMIYLYTAYRDCVNAKVCAPSAPTVTSISKPGIGPIDIMTVLDYAITFSSMPSCKTTPTTCGKRQSCDLNGCKGAFNGLSLYPQCTGNFVGCDCEVTPTTCGPHQSCDLNGCNGKFDGISKYPKCTGNFVGCECTAEQTTTCGRMQSCDLNGCAGKFSGLSQFPQCSGNFEGCDCEASPNTCGAHQSCDVNGCVGAFPGLSKYAECTRNFVGCECTASPRTCGPRQSCDLNKCDGKFLGSTPFAQCTTNFVGCECTATPNTCGPRQSSSQGCDTNGCAGTFDANGVARCSGNFKGCGCTATPVSSRSCSAGGCFGSITSAGNSVCLHNFFGCPCVLDPVPQPAPPPTDPTPPPPPDVPSGPSSICVTAHCLYVLHYLNLTKIIV